MLESFKILAQQGIETFWDVLIALCLTIALGAFASLAFVGIIGLAIALFKLLKGSPGFIITIISRTFMPTLTKRRYTLWASRKGGDKKYTLEVETYTQQQADLEAANLAEQYLADGKVDNTILSVDDPPILPKESLGNKLLTSIKRGAV